VRTTLTLDEDVADKLEDLTRREGISFKAAVNATLRRGLAARSAAAAAPFAIRPFALGAREGVDYDNIGELLEVAEGPRHP
jgi:hypothetical protein